MSDRTAIEHVIRFLGIRPHYTDGLGRTREVSDDTLLALIGAFGLPADPVRAMSLLEEEEQGAPLSLGPVHLVAAEAMHPRLMLRVPRGCSEVLWSCRLENGEHRSGRVSSEGDELFPLLLPEGLPLGYHRLDLEASGITASLSLIVAS
jgi:hypothetical protein